MNFETCLGWIALLGFGAASVAHAAAFAANGVSLGMTQADVQAKFGDKITCTSRAVTDTDPAQATCVSSVFAQKKQLSDTFAGQKTVIRYHILDGRVARISFLGFPSLAFDAIVRTMESSYGKASVVNKEIGVVVKGKLVDSTATWHNGSGDSIVFDKYSPGNIDRSYLNFYSDAWWKARKADPGTASP